MTATVRYAQRPDLWAESDTRSAEVWPECHVGAGTPAGLGDGIDEALVAALDTSAAPTGPTPIERYVAWTRADGEPFDPWIRVRTRRGGVVMRPITVDSGQGLYWEPNVWIVHPVS